ncbi:MAG: helix-turn-helix transcriptional regulator [Thermoanaerobaculia bacterium]
MKGKVNEPTIFDFLIQDPCDWENFLSNFSKKLDLDGAALLIFYQDSFRYENFFSFGLNKNFFQNFEKILKNNSLLFNSLKSLPEGKIVDKNEEFQGKNLEFQEFFEKFLLEGEKVYIFISGILNNCKENLILIGFKKGNKKPLIQKEKDLIEKIIPYIKVVYQYCIRIQKRDCYLDILKRAIEFEGKGIIIIDKNLNVIFLNKIAEAILSSKEGLEITKYGLEINDPVFSIHFKKSLKKIFNSENDVKEDFIFAIPKKDKTIPVVVQVIPISEKLYVKENQRYALIILYDASYYPTPDPEFLTRVFRFTSQEKNIAILLTKGMDLKEISEELKISLHTVRTHLKHIYSKTNTARQAELMKLLLSLPAGY